MTATIAITVFVIAYALSQAIASARPSSPSAAARSCSRSEWSEAERRVLLPRNRNRLERHLPLFGMMIIVGVLRQTGVFEYIAIWSAKRANGSPLRIMILLVLVTAVASAMLDNVTTILLIAPVTLLVCERLQINPIPFLIAEVFASNIGGASTLVGDPPNIIIASRAGLSFNDFLVHMMPIVIIVLIVFIAMVPFLFRGSFESTPTCCRCDVAE